MVSKDQLKMKDDFEGIKRDIPIGQVGMVCWGKVEGFPWWPCKIEKYDDYVKSVTWDADDAPLPPKTNTNHLVVFFDDGKLCSVCETEFLCEYTSNLHLLFRKEHDVIADDITKAYNEANQFIANHGIPLQKSRLKDVGNLDDFRKSRGKPKSKKRDSETGPPSKRKRSRFTRRNSKDGTTNDDANGDIAAKPEHTPAPAPGKSAGNDVSSELDKWKQSPADKNAIKNFKSDEIASFLAAFLVNHDNALAEKYRMLKSSLTSHFRDKFVYGSSFLVPNENDRAVFFEITEQALNEVVEGHALRSLKVRLSQFVSS